MRTTEWPLTQEEMLNLTCNHEKGNSNLIATLFHCHQTGIKLENFI